MWPIYYLQITYLSVQGGHLNLQFVCGTKLWLHECNNSHTSVIYIMYSRPVIGLAYPLNYWLHEHNNSHTGVIYIMYRPMVLVWQTPQCCVPSSFLTLKTVTSLQATDFPRILTQIWGQHGNHRQFIEKHLALGKSMDCTFNTITQYNKFCPLVCFSKLKTISACCVTSCSEQLLLGTEGGNIHMLDTNTFKLSEQIIYQDVVMQK